MKYEIEEQLDELTLFLLAENSIGSIWFRNVRLKALDKEEEVVVKSKEVAEKQQLNIRDLGEPCRVINPVSCLLHYNPNTGREELVINSNTPGVDGSGAAIFIDYEKRKSHHIPFPKGGGGWGIIKTSPNEFLFESNTQLHLIPVDATKKELILDKIKSLKEYKNSYLWSFTKAADSKIYFGSYPSGHLFRIGINNEIEDLGKIGKSKENLYVRYVAATNDGWIICTIGMVQKQTIAYNINTKKQVKIADNDEIPYAIDGNVYTFNNFGRTKKILKFDSKKVRYELLDWSTLKNHSWKRILPASTKECLYLESYDKKYYKVTPTSKEIIWDIPFIDGFIVDIDRKGNAVGLEQNEYFVSPLRSKRIQRTFPLVKEIPAVPILFIDINKQGNVIGGPTFGKNLFVYNSKTKKTTNTPKIAKGGGEVYGVYFHNNVCYAATYPGLLVEWDMTDAFDIKKGKS